MTDFSDYELNKGEAPSPEPPQRTRTSARGIAIVCGAIAAFGLGWYFYSGHQGAEPDALTTLVETTEPASPDRPLGVEAESVDVPPLGETDALVRRLVEGLSSHPRIAAWLASGDLIRRFTVAVESIADGVVPRQALAALAPVGRFSVIERGAALRIDPRSYNRYNGLAAAVDSVDADGAARIFTILKPRIEEAYAELGRDVAFDLTLEHAIVALLRVPVIEGDVGLEPTGGTFGFENLALEKLTAAQKQLLRMGPGNVRIIQRKLRAIALVLGIPPDRLPS